MSTHRDDVIRFTFDCPVELHTIAKMKATSLKQSMKEYLVGLLVKDAVEHPPKYVDNKTFRKALNDILKNDADLMQKLSDR